MKSDVGQFVEEGEPEVVYPVVPQGQSDYWPSAGESEGSPIQVGPGQVGQDLKPDAVLGQEVPGPPWAILRPAELGDLPEEFRE